MAKNHWHEPYPSSLPALATKCDYAVTKIKSLLRRRDCPTLADLYQPARGKMARQTDIFHQQEYEANTRLNARARVQNELKGLYVFAELNAKGQAMPCYVGISRSIFRRLRQHGWGKLHNEATLAYLKASTGHQYTGERKHFPLAKIVAEQEVIRRYRVAIVPETLDYDLHFMEVYIAGKLKTRWNSFRTH